MRKGVEREELDGLYARMEDLALRAERGELAVSSFLSPRELHFAEAYLARKGARYQAFGGYGEAERKRLYLLPDYVSEEGDWRETLESLGFSDELAALRIQGSGYRVLTHRDFLGSLLALGIEREVLGDIAVSEDGSEAVLFCDGRIAVFLERELSRIANDKVRVSRLGFDEFEPPERRTELIRDTVASARLDSVIAALCHLSREKAQQTVCGGSVEVDFLREERPDRVLTAPALLSVRGFGRYRLLSLSDRTKKGRLRLEAEKYL